MDHTQKAVGLCYRCEHRAEFLESGIKARYECGSIKNAVVSCYMFLPVIPVVLEKNKNDKRPMTLNIFSARVHGAYVAKNMKLISQNITKTKKVVFWATNKIQDILEGIKNESD